MPFNDCPLCFRGYHQLSQHLRVSHGVKNMEERKLLLAIVSGRMDVRKSTCLIPACGKSSSRMDRHLKGHQELEEADRERILQDLKRRKILHNLTELRASNPAVPMASTLDLHEEEEKEEDEEEEERACQNCRKLQAQLADLNRQLDTLSFSFREVSRRFLLLRRRSAQVTQLTDTLLSALLSRTPGESEGQGHQTSHTLPRAGSTRKCPESASDGPSPVKRSQKMPDRG